MYLKNYVGVQIGLLRSHPVYSGESFLLVHCSQVGDPPGVSPVTQSVASYPAAATPALCYMHLRGTTPVQRINLLLLSVFQSAPARMLHSCLSLLTSAITLWKWHTASPHTCRKRPCVSTGQPWFAHKQNTDFFAGPSFESCTCTATCPLDSIWPTEFNTICCMRPPYGHSSYSTHVTALNAVVSVHSAHW